MPLLNDNDLDRLSREAADQYDVEQDTSGWEALERRLDVELPQDRRRRGLLLWWLLAGILLLGGALWGIRPLLGMGGKDGITKEEKNIDKLTEYNNRSTANSNNSNLKAPESAGQANDNGRSQTPAASTAPNNAPTHPDQKYAGPGKPASGIRTPSRSPELPYNGNWEQAQIHSSSASATQRPTHTSVFPYTQQQQDLPVRNDSVTRSNPVHASSIQNAPDVPVRKPTPQTSITDSTQQPATVQTRTTANKTKPLNLSSRKNSVYATALAGLDFSNVKFSSAGRTGFNGGILIGYYFTGRFSLNTGLIYNKKNYRARAKDFTPKGPMVYYDIDKIEGGCSMFDIPVNLRYDLGIRARSRYFISAGISSYLMQQEDYDYYFYNNAGDYSQKNWNTSKNSSYLFSILNFSAGLEKQVGWRTWFQAEPYLKMPVNGVGNGDIRLNSFGINLGLKYQFGKKKE